ncbi:phosphomevalonate kinase, partial [Tieghemiomyces parasiticus]
MTARTVVSAPGKVLMAGGYLVLDRMYKGLIIGADARFYTLIQSVEPTAASGPITITVESPQFEDALWTYHATWSDEHSTYTLSNVGPTKNPFLAITLNYTLNLAAYRLRDHDFPRRLGGGLKLVILGDNDFYSQQDKLKEQGRACSTAALSSLPRFSAFPFPLHQVHKTGLGSSAALVTSMVCALMMHLGVDQISQAYPGSTVDSMTSPAFLRWVHHISQYCHCLAQGKIGSGFDVSAAVYGSHIY